MVVDHSLRQRVVVHGVDREVAACRILHLRAPDVVAQHAAGGVDHMFLLGSLVSAGLLDACGLVGRRSVEVGTEGRDLDDLMLAAAAEDHVHEAESPANNEGAPEERLHLLRRSVGGDVEVFRPQPDEQVAYRTANDVGLVAAVLQCLNDPHRVVVEQCRVDAVLLA